MDNASLVGLSRQAALERELGIVANNVANLNTAGFKAENSVFQEFLAPTARENNFATADTRVRFVLDRTGYRNYAQGPIQRTGGPLDIALGGNVFLAVQTNAGERYTRNGGMQINATGQLVLADGTVVAGETGPITFQATDRRISISADGRISVLEGPTGSVETQRGKLKLVTFADPQRLQAEGANLYSATGNAQPQAATAPSVLQGAIEGSNVNGVTEMTRLIEINRTYTQIATMLQGAGDLRKTSIDKLAAVPS